MTEVVGIDPSLTSTGVAIRNETFVVQSKAKGMERLAEIRDAVLSELIELQRCSDEPVVVMVEGYAFAKRTSHAHAQGELGGVLRLSWHEHGFAFVEVPPTCRAKFATGKGNASKSESISSVSARTQQVWSGSGADDECDAWILQEMGLCYLEKPRYDWPERNQTALLKIGWGDL